MYSNITLDCLNAAPTITILDPGIKVAFNTQYTANRKLLPKPRLARYIGNDLFHSSRSTQVCTGNKSMFNSFFTVQWKYLGSFIILRIWRCRLSAFSCERSVKGFSIFSTSFFSNPRNAYSGSSTLRGVKLMRLPHYIKGCFFRSLAIAARDNMNAMF